jgi:hypothetical protein
MLFFCLGSAEGLRICPPLTEETTFTNAYYQWHKDAENWAIFINQNRHHPNAVANGQQELAKAQYSMNYYQTSITNYRNAINQVAP